MHQGPQSDFIPTRVVAYLLGVSVQQFRRKREELIEEHGFPEPLPHSLAPQLWRRDMVEAWKRTQGRPRNQPPPPRPAGPNVVLLEEARRV